MTGPITRSRAGRCCSTTRDLAGRVERIEAYRAARLGSAPRTNGADSSRRGDSHRRHPYSTSRRDRPGGSRTRQQLLTAWTIRFAAPSRSRTVSRPAPPEQLLACGSSWSVRVALKVNWLADAPILLEDARCPSARAAAICFPRREAALTWTAHDIRYEIVKMGSTAVIKEPTADHAARETRDHLLALRGQRVSRLHRHLQSLGTPGGTRVDDAGSTPGHCRPGNPNRSRIMPGDLQSAAPDAPHQRFSRSRVTPSVSNVSTSWFVPIAEIARSLI